MGPKAMEGSAPSTSHRRTRPTITHPPEIPSPATPTPLLSPQPDSSDPEGIEVDPSLPTLIDSQNPTTLTYLSALPIHLRPVSPYLAALHDARIRLLSIQLRSPIRWCINCGSLRDTSLDPLTTKATSGKVQRSPKKKTARSAGSPAAVNCSSCGEKFRRAAKVGARDQAAAEVLASFRPARAVRRSSRREIDPVEMEGDSPAEPAQASVTGGITSEKISDWPALHAEDDPMGGEQPSPLPSTSRAVSPTKAQIPAATPLKAPNLRYIPNTAPSPPTYNQPPSVRPPTATASIGGKVAPISRGGQADETGPKRKKKKASGLAKLLAQSKEREEGEQGGKWGFG